MEIEVRFWTDDGNYGSQQIILLELLSSDQAYVRHDVGLSI